MRLTGNLDPQIQKARLFKSIAVLFELITIYAVIWGVVTAIEFVVQAFV